MTSSSSSSSSSTNSSTKEDMSLTTTTTSSSIWPVSTQDRLVSGPDGTVILCDSPLPSYSSTVTTTTTTKNETTTTKIKKKVPLSTTTTTTTTTSHQKPKRVIGDYTLVNTLGSGSMGKVRLAVNSNTGEKLAVKIVPKINTNTRSKVKKDEYREIRTIREASIMMLLYHPFIVSVKEMMDLDQYFYLFMEYVNGGQLLDYIISHGKLKENQARRFARQIASALDYCHRNSIVHRDLKIENILISQTGNIKIIDFGLSNLFSPRSHLSTFCGSLYFAAPELLNAKAYTGPEVDVWSFGVVLYVLVCGKVPFDDQNMPALHEKIKRGVVDYPSHLSTDCKGILSRMLVTNPAHRATISELIIHPWMNRGYDVPIDNYLPDRAPLTMPLDTEVIRGMTGFEFGTEEEIKQKLESIILSQEYQKAAKLLLERSSSSSSSTHNKRSSFTLANEDPQSIPAAYHPLVSIYYLVKEKLQRQQAASSSSVAPAAIAVVDKEREKYQDDTNNNNTEKLDPTATTLSSSSRRSSNASSIKIPDVAVLQPNYSTSITFDPQQETTNVGPLKERRQSIHSVGRRISMYSSSDPSDEEDDEDHYTTPGVRRLSLAIHPPPMENNNRHQALSNSTPIQHHQQTKPYLSNYPNRIPEETTTDKAQLERRKSRLIPRRMTVGQTGVPDKQFLNMINHNIVEGRLASSKVPLQQLPSNVDVIDKQQQQQTHASFHTSQQDQDEVIYPSPITHKSATSSTADQSIKPVFLKGLFSVTTTSTKHPSIIRNDLIRVLERIGVKWREGKGRFECVHMPSINVTTALPSSLPDLVMRFEIYIVKVPWLLGMHGLQFRRVGGDPWQYKNMCSKILAELKL